MFCPLCGSALKEVKREIKKPKEIDWGAEPKEMDRQIAAWKKYDEAMEPSAEEYECTKGCFRSDYPLLFHGLGGTDCPPGDSWSLSWIK